MCINAVANAVIVQPLINVHQRHGQRCDCPTGQPLLLLAFNVIFLLLQTGPANGLSVVPPTNSHISGILESLVSSNTATNFALRGRQLDHIQPDSSQILRQAWSEASPSALINPKTVATPVTAGFNFGQCSLVGGFDELWRPKASVESVFASAFRSAVESHALHGIRETRMSRYDLYHGHLIRPTFQDANICTLALVFHAAEYPAVDSGVLANVNLGHCQFGSDCRPTSEGWRYRNILWASWWPSSDSIESDSNDQAIWLMDGNATEVASLRVDETQYGPGCPNAIWEGCFGECLADVYCLDGTTVWIACH